LLVSEQAAGPAATDLDFVEYQQQIMAVAQFAHCLQVAGRWDVDATLSLYRFEHDGTGVRTDCSPQSFKITQVLLVLR
jgi:hypothetical protein